MIHNSSRSNSFDLLRLTAATAVIFDHQFLLLGKPEPQLLHVSGLGFFSVLIFFCLSGALITQSWERDPNVGKFLLKRCRRIIPALAVVVSLTVLIVGPLFTTAEPRQYFLDLNTWKYFRTLFLWPQHSWLPGVFAGNPYPKAVNGSLWTLSFEFGLYLSVLGAGVLGLLKRNYFVSLISILLSMLATGASFHHNTMVRDVFLLLFMFWWGAWLRITFLAQKHYDRKNLALGLAALMIMALAGPYSLARTGLVLLASGLVWLAAKIRWGDWITKRTGDLSYGVYIYAFPVQQSMVAAYGKEAFSYWQFLAMSCAITFVLAWLSWHFVEKRFVWMKSKTVMPARNTYS